MKYSRIALPAVGILFCALAAFAFNALVLPRLGGRSLFRADDRARGFPVGILLYPLVVLALVIVRVIGRRPAEDENEGGGRA